MMTTQPLQLFFAGTYSDKRSFIIEPKGLGIVSYMLNIASGEIQQLDLCKEAVNAGYLVKSENKNILFAACDNDPLPGEVKAFAINKNGSLGLLSAESTPGTATCHLDCNANGNRVFAASYGDGNLSVHYFDGKSFLGNTSVIAYKGSGPDMERQEASHIHQAVVSPNGKWLYACDLGSDKIWLHDLSNESGDLQILKGIETPPGYGPRHLIFHQKLPVIYVLCELNSHVLIYTCNDATGSMTLVADEPTLPADYREIPSGAAIKLHPSMKTLYVSNRGHNSLTVFSIDEVNGCLTFETRFSSGGKEPRDFAIDPGGQWLLVVNQNSDNIVPFKLDAVTGLPAGEVAQPFKCGTPVCILFNK
jgi:6-phosphogluconolactonase